jgi:leucyl/phenylalanyl-tRNA--protein transferase
LSTERLQLAYKSGIFPWFEDGEPITWWSPDPRMVLFLDELVVSKACKHTEQEYFHGYSIKILEVISNCQNQAGWTRWDMDYK